MKNKIYLGAKVRDIVTGFEGIATARVEYINGCIQYQVVGPANKDGKWTTEWFDVGRLTYLRQGVVIAKAAKAIPGGDMDTPPDNYVG